MIKALLSLGIVVFGLASPMLAQPAVSVEDLLADADSSYAHAVSDELELWSPRRMAQVAESIHSARAQLHDKNAETIVRVNLDSALESIETAYAHKDVAQERLRNVVEARQAAIAAGAAERKSSAWQEAERALLDMTTKIETGDDVEVDGLRDLLAQQYFAARRESLRDGILAGARTKLEAAKQSGADVQFPTLYARAQQALTRAESELAQEKLDESRLSAAEAILLAGHALGQSKFVNRSLSARAPYEELLLPYDDLLEGFALAWGDSLSFADGGAAATEQMRAVFQRRLAREVAVQDSINYVLGTARQSMEQSLTEMQSSLADQQNRIAEMEQRMLDIQVERDVAVNRLRKREMTAQRAHLAQTAFDAGDAVVYQAMEGHIVIHLYGLKFASGQATIGKDQRSILKKAAEAIGVFPEVTGISVEGHTDDEGSESSNLELSEKRAAAVGQALKEELKSEIPVTTVGKGESAPISTNETARGRALNRRIDLVIAIP